jgi:hypothetical protein
LNLQRVVSLSLLFYDGVGLPMLEVMQGHLHSIVSQGYMTAVDLATCRVHKDHASPILAGGYTVLYIVFYERGFSVPSHWFLSSLLLFYGLKLHHLTPTRILHIEATWGFSPLQF